ncbi:ligand-binding sensor domain-containing protein [Puia sp. P3]|uniref:ligand-binding sensor domain-containing protein n=1 Tax=Puia sp. P3 TaxID=3423952 RepID=UPI003D67C01D
MATGRTINLKKKFLDPYSLSDNAVYSLCKDSEGGVWAGTFFGGVNYYSKQHAFFEKYYPDNSASSIGGSSVREICQDPFNNIWIGTEDAGLNKLDSRTGAITHFMPSGLPPISPIPISTDSWPTATVFGSGPSNTAWTSWT